jgi:hypothetical protein
MIWAILQFVRNSRLARLIGTALAAVAAVLTFGAWKKREGAAENKAKVAAERAADFAETIKDVSNEKPSDDPADVIRSRLRDRAKRKP